MTKDGKINYNVLKVEYMLEHLTGRAQVEWTTPYSIDRGDTLRGAPLSMTGAPLAQPALYFILEFDGSDITCLFLRRTPPHSASQIRHDVVPG